MDYLREERQYCDALDTHFMRAAERAALYESARFISDFAIVLPFFFPHAG